MSAPVQIVALLLGVVELVVRLVLLLVCILSLIGLIIVADDGPVGDLLTPYLWRMVGEKR